MKKLLIAVVTVAALGFAVSQGLACWRGNWDGPGVDHQRGITPGTNPGSDYQAYLDDTKGLRKELAAKQVELEALMAGPNPDPKRAGALSREIADLREQLNAKARARGYNDWCVYGYGHGRGGWTCW